MYTHLLVPSDHSELSFAAARQAVRFAAEIAARVTFFYAVHTPTILNYIVEASPDIDTNPSLMTNEEIAARMQALADRHLRELLAIATESGVRADVDSVVSEQPYQAIIRAAERRQCDLIFMASHGRRGVGALVLGSETQKVLTHCALPVLVWRAPDQR
ncbi:MAG: universal stress protein [Synechococcaceae cyanobacterium]|nr:universal stress protein [Synechococcaceae cyanobacterium]